MWKFFNILSSSFLRLFDWMSYSETFFVGISDNEMPVNQLDWGLKSIFWIETFICHGFRHYKFYYYAWVSTTTISFSVSQALHPSLPPTSMSRLLGRKCLQNKKKMKMSLLPNFISTRAHWRWRCSGTKTKNDPFVEPFFLATPEKILCCKKQKEGIYEHEKSICQRQPEVMSL